MHWRMVAALLAVLLAAPAWADVGHGAHPVRAAAPLWIWIAGLGALTVIALFLIRPARRGTLMSERFRGFKIGRASCRERV